MQKQLCEGKSLGLRRNIEGGLETKAIHEDPNDDNRPDCHTDANDHDAVIGSYAGAANAAAALLFDNVPGNNR